MAAILLASLVGWICAVGMDRSGGDGSNARGSTGGTAAREGWAEGLA